MQTLASINTFFGSLDNAFFLPFLQNIFSNPMHYIGIVISVIAAMGFLSFVRGTFSGLPHVIKIDGNTEHLTHSRSFAIQGMLVVFYSFALLEFLRWIVSGFGGVQVSATVLTTAAALGVFVTAVWYLNKPKKGEGGGH